MAYTLLWGLGILASRKDIEDEVYGAALEDNMGDQINQWDINNYLMAFVKELGRWTTTFRLAFAHETMSQNVIWRGELSSTLTFMR